jgi:hypothetical protein
MTPDEKLRPWLDECEEWIIADDLRPDAIKFLQARLKRAVIELRERM